MYLLKSMGCVFDLFLGCLFLKELYLIGFLLLIVYKNIKLIG